METGINKVTQKSKLLCRITTSQTMATPKAITYKQSTETS